MKKAILFWFYKDLDVCINRLQLLRKYNSNVEIFGLFGGNNSDIELFESKLSPFLDDFTACCTEKDPLWKWKYGDSMISEWHIKKGQYLDWDTIVIAQWDMLLLTDVDKLLGELQKDEVYLSGLRPVSEVAKWWNWVKRDTADYELFLQDMHSKFGVSFEPMCCQFIVVCLPKSFLDKYSKYDLELGFIEYRLPTYASALGFNFAECPKIKCFWPSEPSDKIVKANEISITAQTIPIGLKTIFLHLFKPSGDRVFHPYYRLFPADFKSGLELLLSIVKSKF
jgi:hypothetical protein